MTSGTAKLGADEIAKAAIALRAVKCMLTA